MLQRNFKFQGIFLFLIPLFSFSQETTLVDLNDFYPERIEFAGFTLDSEQEITIESTAIKPYRSDRYKPYTEAWILNSKTRDVVWVLSEAESIDREKNITTFKDAITLEAGNYEVYYSTFLNRFNDDWHNRRGHFPGFFERIFGETFYDDDWGYSRRDYESLYITIKGVGEAKTEEEVVTWQDALKNTALIDFTNMRDEKFEEQIIEVTKPTDFNIYAIGEASDDGDYDFGWIIDLSNRNKVWDLTFRHSGHAGGAPKNRISEETLTLEPGKYKVFYVTDDSHSPRKWNAAPPYDPVFWGLAMWTINQQDKASIVLLDKEDEQEKNVIVKFDRVGDQEYLSKGFTLKKPLTLHIYALGEGRDGDMYDYGWVVDLKTRKKVWTMKYRNTENAGGSKKNRFFDGTITLEPGNYMAHYVTDGSHSFRRWNSGRPYDEDSWGMRISVLDENYSEGDVVAYNEADDKSILVRITRVGDYDRVKARFELDKDQDIHIYAIGEGMGNEMYDYAWIENSRNGRVVWEMSYRQTERAGGARKNRMFDDNIYLEAGEYEVFYETDDSHSYADWNDSPPNDPVNWGITISRVDK